jgi:hypothetical protein
MAGRPRNDSDTPEQYWSPRGSISWQLLKQPGSARHEYSRNMPTHLDLNQWPDVHLHSDMLELFLTTPHAARIYPPYMVQPADAHGWAILNDATLLPTIDAFGLLTDGEGRMLGQVIGAGFPIQAPMLLPSNQFSSIDLGGLSPGETFTTNPWSPSRQQPLNLASPAPTNASLFSRAETVVAHSDTYTDPNPGTNYCYFLVYDRNFDVGVSPL